MVPAAASGAGVGGMASSAPLVGRGATTRTAFEGNEDGGVDVVLEGIEIAVERSENPWALSAGVHDRRWGWGKRDPSNQPTRRDGIK
jgi:hypothetical protein